MFKRLLEDANFQIYKNVLTIAVIVCFLVA